MQISRTDLSVNITVDGLSELAAVHGDSAVRLANTFMRRAIESEVGPFDRVAAHENGNFAVEMADATTDEAEEFLDRVRCHFDIQMFDAGFEVDVELSLGSDLAVEEFSVVRSADQPFYLN